jgi:hypothetical protein
MPKKLEYQDVYDYIKSKGYELISKEYVNVKTLLEIKCGVCNKIYHQYFRSFREGCLHPYCQNEEKKLFGGYKHPIILIPINCIVCNKEFKPKYSNKKMCSRECYRNYKHPVKLSPIICIVCNKEFQPKSSKAKICSSECSKINQETDEYKEKVKNSGRIGGRISASNQSKRSKNEIYFSELCSNYFEITTNEPFFEGWDADIIIHSEKVAILWNGIWHYKQISKTQSLIQVQSRDKIKTSIIERMGYIPYVIKDMGKYNRKFVEQEFEIFLLMRMRYE